MHLPQFVSTIGSSTRRAAKRVGSGTADIAAKVGGGTATLARRIGPKRAIIGLVVIAGAIAGGIVLTRYFKRRSLEKEGMEASDAVAPDRTHTRNGKISRDATT